MTFFKVKEIFEKKPGEAQIRGWVYRHRASKNAVFVMLRDSSGVIQCTFKKGEIPDELFEKAESLSIESSVKIRGDVKEDKRAPGGFEVKGKELEVIHMAERFPIVRDKSTEFLRDVRHLWVRSQEMTAIMKIRDTVYDATREFMKKMDCYEIEPPILTPVGSEGGSSLFEVDYFGKKMYLTQSWQLYAEALIFALERIYTISPCFRAEKSKTSRHVTEFWMTEMEAAWMEFEELAGFAEETIVFICGKVLEKNKKELEILGRDPKDLKLETPFKRITYDKALETLEKNGMKVKYGEDLGATEETKIAKLLGGKPILITHYPKEIMAFYKKKDPKNPKLTLNFNIIAPDIGEILDASEREPDIEEINRIMKKEGIDPKDCGFYMDTRKYGSVPHSGFGMGTDRVVQWICGLDSIQEAIIFPRTMRRTKP